MKRTLLFIVMLLLAVTVAFGLSSCDDGTYTVTFTVDGEVYLTATVTSGSNVQFPENPTKEGYKFTGWELNGENISEDMIISGSVTFVAMWEKEEGTDIGEHVHTLTHHNAVSATCTVNGNIEYWHCALCNKYYSDANTENEITSITVTTNGHVLTHYDAKAFGCTTDGNIAYWHCSVCDKNFSDLEAKNEVASVTINASHVLTYHNAVEEGCTIDGSIEYWHCSICEKSFADANAKNEVANITVSKTGHSLSHNDAVSADCTTNGNIEHWYCSSCEKYFTDENAENMVSTVIIPAAHTLTHHAAVDAGCITDGNMEYWYCIECENNFSDSNGRNQINNIVLTQRGHSLAYVAANEPTCTENGNIEHWYCSACEKYFADANAEESVATVIIPAKHNLTYNAAVGAGCTSDGNIEYWYCTDCEKNFSDANGTNEISDITITQTGHSLAHVGANTPTCTAGGNIEYWYCLECEKCYSDEEAETEVDSVTVSKEGHSLTHYNAVSPTCTIDGNIEYWHCSKCNKFYTDVNAVTEVNSVTVSKTGHSLTHYDAVSPTCTADGNIEYWHCSKCNKFYTDANAANEVNSVAVSKIGHSLTHYDAVSPTCTEDGNIEHWYCSSCNKYFTDANAQNQTLSVTVSKRGHSLTHRERVEPTCTANGNIEYWFCTVCEKYYSDAYAQNQVMSTVLSKKGHSLTHYSAVSPTCTEDGNIEYWYCSSCKKYFSDETATDEILTVVVKAAHSYVGNECEICGDFVESVGLSYKLSEDETYYIVTGIGTCTDKSIFIPAYYNGLPIKKIGSSAFSQNAQIEKVKIGANIEIISTYAFNNCDSLVNVDISDSVSYIGEGAFSNCDSLVYNNYDNARYLGNHNNPYLVLLKAISTSINSCNIHRDTRFIHSEAFEDCSRISNISLPDALVSIGEYAFYYCTSLKKISINEALESVGTNAFSNCSNLQYNVYDNAKYLGNETNPYIVLVKLSSYTINSCQMNSDTRIIYHYAFAGSNIESIEVPDSVISIGRYAFQNCNKLTKVSIGSGVEKIEYSAFYNSNKIASVNISSVASWCDIEFGDSVSNPIRSDAKVYINEELVTDLIIPNGVNKIRDYAFRGCTSITGLRISDSVEYIGEDAFSYCRNLRSITVEENNAKYIGIDGNLYTSDSKTLVLYAIGKTDTNFSIPAGVENIASYAFAACESLESIETSDSVTSIGYAAFSNCTSLSGVYISDMSSWCAIDFESYSANPLYYAENLYLNGGLVTDLVIPDGVNRINDYAFYYYKKLESIEIPNSVESIGDDAFYGCSSLEGVYISDMSSWCAIDFYGGDSNPLYYAKKLYLNGEPVTDLVIPEGVDSVGNYAFYGYTNLTSVTIPISMKQIGYYTFSNCTSLSGVYISDMSSWCAIEFDDYLSNPLYYAKKLYLNGELVTDLVIPTGVTSIGKYAFYYCESLLSITIPSSVMSVGSDAFVNCSNIGSVYISDIVSWCGIDFDTESSNPLYRAGNLYINEELATTLEIPKEATYIGAYVFSGAKNITHLKVADGVTASPYAFRFGTLESLTVPATILDRVPSAKTVIITSGTKIPEKTFQYNKVIESITIPDSITRIEMYAFRECSNLKTVGLGANSKLNYIGWGAFEVCSSLNSIRIPSSVTRIDTNAFCGCTGIESVYISDVAEWCKIDFQAIDANPLYYGAGNLYLNGNLVTYLGIPDNVTKISSFAFYGCDSIVDVAIGNGVRTIGVGAFYNCSNLSNVTFGDSVTTVEAWAFKDCLRLENVVFADKVFSVGDDAFYGCSNLEGVYITDITKWCTIEFYDYYSNPLYYAKKLYLNRELVTNLVIPTGVTSIGKYAFYNNDNIVTVTIPNTLKISGACAFDGCKNITTVNINNIEAWYNIKFEGETSTPVYYAKNLYINGELLTSLEIKNGVTEIGPYTFLCCTSLTSLIIPDSVTNIGTYAFLGCQVESATIPSVAISAIPKKALKTVIITSGSSIPNNAFSDCQNLESVKIPYSVYSIGDYAFENCSRLENIKIPSSVDSIGAYALYNCRSLRSINIPDSVASIGNYAFSGCYKLVEVINKSSLNIVAGDSSYGYVAYYAIEVHSGASKIVEEDGYFFYIYSGGNYLFGCRDIETKLILPETYRGENYKISDYAFYECKDVEEIYFNAIAMNDLNENNYAFEYVGQNSNGIKVVIGKNVTKIPAYLFSSSPKITSVEFEEGSVCKSIGSSAFSWCESLKTITIPESVISIGEDAFEFCRALEEIYFNAIAMSDCSSRSGVFEYAGQNGKVIIGKNVTKIPAYLFDNSDIINVEFEEGSVCQSISSHAFSYCTSLASIEIPNSVTSIGDYAFSVCPSLKYNEYDNAYYLGNDANPYLVLVKAKDTSITSCDINDNTKIVYYDAFYGCTSLDSIEIPSSVISVYGDVFHGCKKLKSVVFGNNSQLTSIGSHAFYTCTSLTSIEIPASVTNIGAYAFDYCTSLESVTFGNNGQLISISSHAFSYCTSLASIEIPNSVTSIGDYAFYCCTSLEGVTFGNDSQLISMGHYAFADCTSLTNVEIPNSVTSIGMGAFKECINLAYNKYGKCFYLGNDTNPYLVLVCMYGLGSDFSVHASTKIICLNAFYNASSITFENPNGWWCSLDFDATSGTSISATDLANPETAATYLNSTYCNYYWKRT